MPYILTATQPKICKAMNKALIGLSCMATTAYLRLPTVHGLLCIALQQAHPVYRNKTATAEAGWQCSQAPPTREGDCTWGLRNHTRLAKFLKTAQPHRTLRNALPSATHRGPAPFQKTAQPNATHTNTELLSPLKTTQSHRTWKTAQPNATHTGLWPVQTSQLHRIGTVSEDCKTTQDRQRF